MEEQIPPSQAPVAQKPSQQISLEGQITPEQLAELKARARQAAIQQAVAQQQQIPQSQPQVVCAT